jgi:hypothetical protein
MARTCAILSSYHTHTRTGRASLTRTRTSRRASRRTAAAAARRGVRRVGAAGTQGAAGGGGGDVMCGDGDDDGCCSCALRWQTILVDSTRCCKCDRVVRVEIASNVNRGTSSQGVLRRLSADASLLDNRGALVVRQVCVSARKRVYVCARVRVRACDALPPAITAAVRACGARARAATAGGDLGDRAQSRVRVRRRRRARSDSADGTWCWHCRVIHGRFPHVN